METEDSENDSNASNGPVGGEQPARSPGFDPPSVEELQKLLPAYEFIKFVDKGGMGAVYKAVQPGLSRTVAVKLLPPDVGTDMAFDKRFRREAKTMAKLSHPNIVSVFDFGETSEGHLYFVMEFVEGSDLRHLIQHRELRPDQILPIINQVCDALQYAHDNGVIHRDVKPANILIDESGRVKVADFGLAKPREGAADTSMISMVGFSVGTPSYMAPEALEEEEIDHRADIYSLGVVIYEMLTGSVPKGAWEPPSKCAGSDLRFDEVVHRAMQADREERFQKAEELSHAFDTESFIARQHPRSHRRSRRLFSVAMIFLVAVLVVGFFLYTPAGRQFDFFGYIPRKPLPLTTEEFDKRSREMAAWIFTKGGFVQIRTHDENIYSKSDLPKGVFEIWRISLEDQSTFVDEDMRTLVDYLEPLPTVTNLNFMSSAITPAGLAELKRISGQLTGLNIAYTSAASDDSIDTLSKCKKLGILIISPESQSENSAFPVFTSEGIEKLSQDLPNTIIRDR